MNLGARIFRPPRRAGILFHAGLLIVFSVAAVWVAWQISVSTAGPDFLKTLLFTLVVIFPIPLLIYRLRALQNAQYILERDGIRLRWGFRAVDIPMNQVDWVYRASEMRTRPPRPLIFWPGAVIGSSMGSLPGAGRVEYMAANFRNLVLIRSGEHVYGITPEDVEDFIHTFRRQTELGSLTPIRAYQQYPTFVLPTLWALPLVRYMLLSALALALILFIWVSLVIPTRPQVFLGAAGMVLEPLPSTALYILPFVYTLFLGLDWGLGLFYFRRNTLRTMAYLLWGSSVLTGLLFLTSLVLILSRS